MEVGARRHRPPHPRETLERCALKSQLRGDAMLGTAFPAERVLLVEQPGPWGLRGLADSRFDADVAAELDILARRSAVRIQAIRRPGRTAPGQLRRWAFADTRDDRETLTWGTYQADRELLDLSLDEPDGTVDNEPLYLVCAHSKHDTCCALRGRPVAAAIESERPGRVWETSHLGGDRFAANVLVLPVGLQYGRVLPFAAPEFVAAADAGEVIGALLRGRVGLAPVSQAAVAHVHEQLGLRRRQDLQVVSATAVVDGSAVVHLNSPHGPLRVTVRVDRKNVTGLTCANRGPGSYFSYRPILIENLSDDM